MANWFIGFPVHAWEDYERIFAGAPSNVRRFHPLDLHITLAFLGNVGPERARMGWQTLSNLSRDSIRISLGRLLPFGRPDHPSAYSFILEKGREETIALIKEVRDDAIDAAGARPDYRPPKPHLTIGRPPRRISRDESVSYRNWIRAVEPPSTELLLDRIALYTWSDDRSERQFKIEATIPMKG